MATSQEYEEQCGLIDSVSKLRKENGLLKKAFKAELSKKDFCSHLAYCFKKGFKCGSDECVTVHTEKAGGAK